MNFLYPALQNHFTHKVPFPTDEAIKGLKCVDKAIVIDQSLIGRTPLLELKLYRGI